MYITIWYVTVTHYSTFPRYAMITAASASHLQHLISNCATTNTKTTYTIQNPYIYIYKASTHTYRAQLDPTAIQANTQNVPHATA